MTYEPEDPLDPLPPIPIELIEGLQARFPLRLPTPDGRERDDLYYSGQQEVICFLIEARNEQIERNEVDQRFRQ